MDRSLPASAGDSFNPWFGKIPHALEQLSPCATTTEPELQSPWTATVKPMLQLPKPACLEPEPCNKRSRYDEKPVYYNEE